MLSYTQRHTSVATGLGHGLGEIITALAARLPVGDIGFSQTFFHLSQTMSYDFGASSRLLSETDKGFNTGSTRNVYSPDVTCARELIVDQLAARMGKDPCRFRHDFLGDDRSRAVLAKVAEAGRWRRAMPAGTAQGIAFHAEYKAVSAALVEIDCRPETQEQEQVDHALTGAAVRFGHGDPEPAELGHLPVQLGVVRLAAAVGQLEPLLAGPRLAPAEVLDRGHEVAPLIGQGHEPEPSAYSSSIMPA
ncbi:hypothetical protein GCM10022419_097940 [Nonomuraea rosea]|uniref:Uncharacterized protein n=1 Tax=Nonomuraea rosea TaxID=638574 RepID=A0ABP6Z5P5_9ACTN